MSKPILVVNAGSSSHKCALFSFDGQEYSSPIWIGRLDWTKVPGSVVFQVETDQKYSFEATIPSTNVREILERLVRTIWEGEGKVLANREEIGAIGHRVVHGGAAFHQPTLITEEVKAEIRKLIPIAPLHNPANLEGIQIMQSLFPDSPQVAVFDTAFHRGIPETASTYPIPEKWRDMGVLRYGFHGISHEYCAHRVAQLMGKELASLKIITCHIGNGSSLTAISEGKSVDTTMGFTPMEGLMMGTRSGSIDPGILLYLLREQQTTVEDLDKSLNDLSGLKGIAGCADMREVEKRMRQNDPDAKLAFAMYVHRFKAYLGSLAANLGGLDVLVFTGGIGENSVEFREAACTGLDFFGIKLDEEENARKFPDCHIARNDSKVAIWVIKTREEWEIGRQSLLFA